MYLAKYQAGQQKVILFCLDYSIHMSAKQKQVNIKHLSTLAGVKLPTCDAKALSQHLPLPGFVQLTHKHKKLPLLLSLYGLCWLIQLWNQAHNKDLACSRTHALLQTGLQHVL